MISADAIRTSHSTTTRRVDLAGLFDRFPRLEGASSSVSGSASAVGVAPLPDPPTLESVSVTGSTPVAAGAADATTSVGSGSVSAPGGSGRPSTVTGRAPRRPSSRVGGRSLVARQDPGGRGPRRLSGVIGPDHGRQRAELQQETLEEGRTTDREHDLVATVAERPGGVLGQALDHPRRLGREAQGDPGIGRVGPVHEVAEVIGRLTIAQWPRLEVLAGGARRAHPVDAEQPLGFREAAPGGDVPGAERVEDPLRFDDPGRLDVAPRTSSSGAPRTRRASAAACRIAR